MIGDYVSKQVEEGYRLAARMMHDYAVEMNMSEPEGDITLYVLNLDELKEAYQKETGHNWKYGDSQGIAFGRSIFMNNSAQPPNQSKTSALYLGAHEISHAQRHLINDMPFGAPDTEVPKQGPRWLSEGIAEFHAVRMWSNSGRGPYSHYRSLFKRKISDTSYSLSNMETREGMSSVKHSYHVSFMAGELLAHLAGESSFYSYHASLNPKTPWGDAFKNNFGLSVTEFYELFEEHKEAGFPDLGFTEGKD